MGHCAIAHLRPQRSPDRSDSFCLLFFFSFFCYDLTNFKIVFLSLYSDNLIILEFRDVGEKDCCVCSCERREKELFFQLRCMNFLSRKTHLELLQCSLYLEKHCSNFKKYLEKFCI